MQHLKEDGCHLGGKCVDQDRVRSHPLLLHSIEANKGADHHAGQSAEEHKQHRVEAQGAHVFIAEMVLTFICRHFNLSRDPRVLTCLEHIIYAAIAIKNLEIVQLGPVLRCHRRGVLGRPFAINWCRNTDYLNRSVTLFTASRLFRKLLVVLVSEDAHLQIELHAGILVRCHALMVNDSLLDLYLHLCVLHDAEFGAVVALRLLRESCLAAGKLGFSHEHCLG